MTVITDTDLFIKTLIYANEHVFIALSLSNYKNFPCIYIVN